MTTAEAAPSHVVIDPSILYLGTPVVLISSVARDGAANLMPMSSAFWLGHTGILGVGTRSQTCQNLLETGECVLNLPDANLVSQVNRLALTTGRYPVPEVKAEAGYEYVADKFSHAGFTRISSDLVVPPRVAECPVNLEARIVDRYPLEKTTRRRQAAPSPSKRRSCGCMSTGRSGWQAPHTALILTHGDP